MTKKTLARYPQMWREPTDFGEALEFFETTRDLAISANHNTLARLLDLETEIREHALALEALHKALDAFTARLDKLHG